MFEVLAIRIVRSISGLPVRGSRSLGNSVSTSVISFPRSPQPMKTITWASHHLARACWSIVLPVPNPPGSTTVPPLATGKRVSITRCPVASTAAGGIFRAYGRPLRTGQRRQSVTARSPPGPEMTAIVSLRRYSPSGAIDVILPSAPGGASTRCSMLPVSWTAAMTAPARTGSPARRRGATGQVRSRSRTGRWMPRRIYCPPASRIAASGRWMPSKIPPRRPGPSSAESGIPVP